MTRYGEEHKAAIRRGYESFCLDGDWQNFGAGFNRHVIGWKSGLPEVDHKEV